MERTPAKNDFAAIAGYMAPGYSILPQAGEGFGERRHFTINYKALLRCPD